jgi:hypothetical protein
MEFILTSTVDSYKLRYKNEEYLMNVVKMDKLPNSVCVFKIDGCLVSKELRDEIYHQFCLEN